MLSNAQFKRVCKEILKKIKEETPYDTGNLSINGIRAEFPSPDVCRIYVDETIAPYMPYTNEPWLSPYWEGKKNPNEGWWQGLMPTVCNMIAQALEGEVKNGR